MNRLTSLLRLAQALTSLPNSLRTQKLNKVMRFMWKESLCAIFKNLPFSNCNDSECQNLSRPNSVTPWMLYLGYPTMVPQQVKTLNKQVRRCRNWKKRMIEPQVQIQGSNKRPKGKKNKKTVNPKEVIDDPPYAGDELRVIPPHPTVPTNLAMLGASSAGKK